MINNTETIEQSADLSVYDINSEKETIRKCCNTLWVENNPEFVERLTFAFNKRTEAIVSYQKEKYEAKIVSLIAEMESWKSENFENLESANKTILEWEAKYKALLDSHEDLLKLVVSCQPLIIRNYGNEEMAKAFETVINKAKNL